MTIATPSERRMQLSQEEDAEMERGRMRWRALTSALQGIIRNAPPALRFLV
jgi:hypothetical protein